MITERNLRIFFLIIGLFLFTGIRVYHLDGDAPITKLMRYFDADEPYYAISGFNWYHDGHYTDTRLPFCERDASTLLFTDSVFSAVTLTLFGNNFYGLRLSAVLASVLILLLLLRAFRGMRLQLQEESVMQRWFPVFAVYYLALDPAFLIGSRIHEPGIFRTIYIVALLALFVYRDRFYVRRNWVFPVLTGFLATCSVLLGYPHNAFLLAAAGTTILLLAWDKKRPGYTFMQCLFFGAGIVAGAGLFVLLNSILTGIPVSDMFVYLNAAASDHLLVNRVPGLMERLSSLFISNLSTNIFRLNPGFMLLVLLAFPLLLAQLRKKERRPADIFVAVLTAWWFLQTFFENSYPEKRHAVMLPVFLFLVYRALDFIRISLLWKRWVMPVLFAGSVLVVLFVIRGVKLGVLPTMPDVKIYWLIGLCSFAAIAGVLLIYMTGKVKWNNRVAFVLVPLLLLTGSVFAAKQVGGATFKFRDTVQAIQQIVGNERMAGGASMNVRLYGTGEVYLNTFPWLYDVPEYTRRMNELFKKHDCTYTLLYTGNKINKLHMTKWLQQENLEIKFDSVATFYLNNQEAVLFRKSADTGADVPVSGEKNK